MHFLHLGCELRLRYTRQRERDHAQHVQTGSNPSPRLWPLFEFVIFKIDS